MTGPATGNIHERITAIGSTAYPAYLVRGDEKSFMIDSGLNLLGPRYIAGIEESFVGAPSLEYLFLTHSHYDHLGSADYVRRHVAGLRLAAHERTAALVLKPSALATMNHLSAGHTDVIGMDRLADDVTLHPFTIDIILRGGDQFDLGGLTCRVYDTPGHTRDSLTFYFPEIRALFPGDACGVPRDGDLANLQVQFVSSYRDYVDSLRLAISLEPEIVCPGHNWVLTGKDAPVYLEASLAETFRHRELIESHLEAAGGDIERAIREIAHDQCDVKRRIIQHRDAYLANLTAQVKHIAAYRARNAP